MDTADRRDQFIVEGLQYLRRLRRKPFIKQRRLAKRLPRPVLEKGIHDAGVQNLISWSQGEVEKITHVDHRCVQQTAR